MICVLINLCNRYNTELQNKKPITKIIELIKYNKG